MAKEIKWTKTAAKGFDRVVTYLSDNWSAKVVAIFIRTTNEVLFLLSVFPDLGEMQDEKRKIRGILITKHNRLFYRIDGNLLIVLKIFDTRQNPKKLRFK